MRFPDRPAAAGRAPEEAAIDVRPTTIALFAGMVIAIAQTAPLLEIPLFFQIAQRLSPLMATIALAPFIVALIVSGPVAGALLDALQPARADLPAASPLCGLGNVLFAQITTSTGLPVLHPALLCRRRWFRRRAPACAPRSSLPARRGGCRRPRRRSTRRRSSSAARRALPVSRLLSAPPRLPPSPWRCPPAPTRPRRSTASNLPAGDWHVRVRRAISGLSTRQRRIRRSLCRRHSVAMLFVGLASLVSAAICWFAMSAGPDPVATDLGPPRGASARVLAAEPVAQSHPVARSAIGDYLRQDRQRSFRRRAAAQIESDWTVQPVHTSSLTPSSRSGRADPPGSSSSRSRRRSDSHGA